MESEQIDTKMALLNGTLEKKIYLEPPTVRFELQKIFNFPHEKERYGDWERAYMV